MKQPKSQKFLNPSLVYFFGALAGFLGGYNPGILSGCIIFIQHDFTLDAFQKGLLVSAILIGSIAGSIIFGSFSDRFGRKKTILVIALIYLVAAPVSAFCQSFITLLSTRIFMGLALGAATVTVPTYLSELAPVGKRGFISSLFALLIATGYFVAYCSNYFLAEHELDWRLMMFLGIIPAIFLVFGCPFLPESTRFLVKSNQVEEAKRVLNHFNGNDEKATIADIQSIINIIYQEIGGLRTVFDKLSRPSLFVGVMLTIFSQLTGINVICFWTPSIIAEFSGDASSSLVINIFLGFTMLVTTAIARVFADKIGRKALLLVGALVCGFMLIILALSLSLLKTSVIGLPVAVTSVIGVTISYCATWGMVGWTILGEIFPLNVRCISNSIAMTTNSIFSLFVAFCFPLLIEIFPVWSVLLVFAIFCILAAVFVRFKIFETRGKSLEEIEEIWHRRQ
ncbi:MAG: sugar porter family MFS transporter [Eggerthellaceae bacterium]|nr:sugar porter family MFS transporter [Eggerthellaceae bacterium]